MEIEIIKPKIICLIGSTAAKAFLCKNIKMNQVRGKIIQKNEENLYVVFHPAYVLRGIKSRKPLFYSDIKNLLKNF